MFLRILLFFILYAELAYSEGICDKYQNGIIWCDDFENNLPLSSKYFEYDSNNRDCIVLDGVGRNGSKGIRVLWQNNEVSAGSLKKSFGRTPDNYIGKYSTFPDSSFKEIYWRMDVKHQKGWTGGGPAKLSRALTLANSNWAEGMMAHLWSGCKNNVYLVMDPASGISTDGILVSTKYNDFDNLRWLGNKPGNIDLFSETNSGEWFCVEGYVKLNTPGISDGVFEFWINDIFQAGSYNLNWHSNWNQNPDNMTINAVFFENYWNSGSPVEQERYFDNLIISTQRIGCDVPNSITTDKVLNEPYIYPNPVTNILHLETKLPILKIEIFNLIGLKILEFNYQDNMDLSNLPQGMYFLKSGSNFLRFVKI
jgi:hypothetical protein